MNPPPLATPGEPIDIHPFGDGLPSATSATLVKTDGLEVLRLVLVAGKKLPTHQVASRLTVQCIEGSVEFAARGRSHVMRAGTLLFLGPGEPHSVEPLENSFLLITRLLSEQSAPDPRR